MKSELHKKIAQFVFKNEILILILLLGITVLKYLNFPGIAIITIIGIQFIAMTYFISGFNETDKQSKNERFLTKIIGIGSGLLLVGFLFSLMHWPGWKNMILVGIISTLGCLIFSIIKSDSTIVQTETKLRLLVLILIGTYAYVFYKPSEIQLFRTIINDFKINKVLDLPVDENNTIEFGNNEKYTEIWNMLHVDIVQPTDHEKLVTSPELIDNSNAYFTFQKPKLSEDQTEAQINLTYNCGEICSFYGEYLYKTKGSIWYQDSTLFYKTW